MSGETPRLDSRSAEEIFAFVASQCSEQPNLTRCGGAPLVEALAWIFARYCELIIQRLNQVPDKNYLAFLNGLEVSRIPPVPAQVPLTFQPVKQPLPTGTTILVPAHTKVAAPPSGDETEPVVFETVCPLELTQAELCQIIVHDPQSDRYADRSAWSSAAGSPGEDVFAGEFPATHAFYIGHKSIFGAKGIARLRLRFTLENPLPPLAGRVLEWWLPTPAGERVLLPAEDTTRQLTQSGEVVFVQLPEWPAHTLFGRENHWLGCRWSTPLEARPEHQAPFPLPCLLAIAISATWQTQAASIEQAFFNSLPLDTSKDFFPLGERPRFGDVFYLNCAAFSRPGAEVALRIELTNPASAGEASPLRPVSRQGKPAIQWETWSGERWIGLACRDQTQALTEDGDVAFTVPATAAQTTVNGQKGAWLRARLMAGNYGGETWDEWASAAAADQGRPPSPPAPPAIRSLVVTSSASAGPQPPEAVIAHNDLSFELIDVATGNGFSPFRPADNPSKALYLGFGATHPQVLADRTLCLYCHPGEPVERLFSRAEPGHPPLFVWQYWNGEEWRECRVSDATKQLAAPGLIKLQVGEDLAPWKTAAFGPKLYWLRMLWQTGECRRPPRLKRLALNTVPATHSLTLEDELLGSSNGTPGQVFRSARAPLLGKPRLEVREPDLPAAAELARLQREEGERIVAVVREATGRGQATWVRWRQVADFLSSTAQDRHYVVDPLTGVIRFGDGTRGRIPPAGANSLRLSYQTGGGSGGNRPADSIIQLRTTVPFVAAATNREAAVGGQASEDWRSVRERGSRWLRHRDRAVTVEDYEDLAREASPAVAKAKCYPLRDLVDDPAGQTVRPGVVSVVIVPRGADPSPRPTEELLRQVRGFLDRRRPPDVDLVVLAPDYVCLAVAAEVMPAPSEQAVDLIAECDRRLSAYLHPLSGGPDGRGWSFGQLPQQSDLYALLEDTPGLDHVRSLQLSLVEERPGLLRSGLFLCCAGRRAIRLSL